ALPGKIIQALKRVGTENPLVLIDEVDKIGRGINGDPASALLEMLDPEQNNSFLDHYMDVPVDLSRVLFVCTANNLDTIPALLLDHMEVLEVSGYVTEEKAAIMSRYLGPQAKEASGLGAADIYRKAALKLVEDLGEETFPEPNESSATSASASDAPPTTSAVSPLLDEDSTPSPTSSISLEQEPPKTVESQEPFSNEPSLEHQAAQESLDQHQHHGERKVITTHERQPMAIPESVHVRITPENLKDCVGPPVCQKDRMYATPPPPGVSTGLGYVGNGSGAIMPVEAMSMPGKGGLQLTGKLGEVIRESAQIGLSWVKAHAYELGITNNPEDQFLTDRDVHVHMPEGSIGKEGPSAGIALLSAFVSLFMKTRINPDIAMTGEISLVGQVLPVGGLKEKILAAHRAGIKMIIALAANRADVEENVPESVKTGIRFVCVENVREVLEVFGEQGATERGEGQEAEWVRKIWAEQWSW
ncbi:hypothetical protein P691DRAFT_768607, partial [Macrolepiota fuliginosa MF-IS2]